ncbi:protein-L-isoaspartate O-methyltransferase [Streptomyces mashuensis]|uniref:Protein-L-isoaspartate O-methyltransferase n=1 Tax=Streptomyces mashuensis TaxID=33904 RepID=A0A919B1G9_9ACTN|nr:methyltransferase domain-containing protein [Streptomyces mashuensis]GHF38897.1 protein-L-isoaspartate O-methyltransferase [Streptomyces mashuensis]
MPQNVPSGEPAALRGLLAGIIEENGALPEKWASAITAVPRRLHLPRVIWQRDDQGNYIAIDAETNFGDWFSAAYAATSVVTQVNDGNPVDPDVSAFPSSSASAPSIVARMLSMLDPRPGQRVLEIGTGTGWNAALLAHAIGEDNVVTIEVDATLAEQAATALKQTAPGVRVVCGDGTLGYPEGAPYDHVLATCSVSAIPEAWIEQIRPGGTILTPWSRPWCDYGLLHLAVEAGGKAAGRFHPYAAFMRARGHRLGLRLFRDVVADDHQPDESRTSLSPWSVAGDDWDAQFALGLRCPDLWHVWHDDPDVDGVATRLWVVTADGSSWAAVDHDGRQDDEFAVWQHGPRRLWNEVEAAWHWWTAKGRPEPSCFGLTVAGAKQEVWLGVPQTVVN